MPLTEILVYSGIAVFAAYPLLASGLTSFLAGLRAKKEETADAWQTRWVTNLIALQADLESQKNATAVKLTRELIWELLGGDQP